ncbi:hypothetical protein SNEBB_003959 [Seison nebaliae]|nr:hypothetical protein SNEBB_003959 [Seison nebaliae]
MFRLRQFINGANNLISASNNREVKNSAKLELMFAESRLKILKYEYHSLIGTEWFNLFNDMENCVPMIPITMKHTSEKTNIYRIIENIIIRNFKWKKAECEPLIHKLRKLREQMRMIAEYSPNNVLEGWPGYPNENGTDKMDQFILQTLTKYWKQISNIKKRFFQYSTKPVEMITNERYCTMSSSRHKRLSTLKRKKNLSVLTSNRSLSLTNNNQEENVFFIWYNFLDGDQNLSADINEEELSILFNLAAAYSQIAVRETLNGDFVRVKNNFENSAAIFNMILEMIKSDKSNEDQSTDFNQTLLQFITNLMIAQAQEAVFTHTCLVNSKEEMRKMKFIRDYVSKAKESAKVSDMYKQVHVTANLTMQNSKSSISLLPSKEFVREKKRFSTMSNLTSTHQLFTSCTSLRSTPSSSLTLERSKMFFPSMKSQLNDIIQNNSNTLKKNERKSLMDNKYSTLSSSMVTPSSSNSIIPEYWRYCIRSKCHFYACLSHYYAALALLYYTDQFPLTYLLEKLHQSIPRDDPKWLPFLDYGTVSIAFAHLMKAQRYLDESRSCTTLCPDLEHMISFQHLIDETNEKLIQLSERIKDYNENENFLHDLYDVPNILPKTENHAIWKSEELNVISTDILTINKPFDIFDYLGPMELFNSSSRFSDRLFVEFKKDMLHYSKYTTQIEYGFTIHGEFPVRIVEVDEYLSKYGIQSNDILYSINSIPIINWSHQKVVNEITLSKQLLVNSKINMVLFEFFREKNHRPLKPPHQSLTTKSDIGNSSLTVPSKKNMISSHSMSSLPNELNSFNSIWRKSKNRLSKFLSQNNEPKSKDKQIERKEETIVINPKNSAASLYPPPMKNYSTHHNGNYSVMKTKNHINSSSLSSSSSSSSSVLSSADKLSRNLRQLSNDRDESSSGVSSVNDSDINNNNNNNNNNKTERKTSKIFINIQPPTTKQLSYDRYIFNTNSTSTKSQSSPINEQILHYTTKDYLI